MYADGFFMVGTGDEPKPENGVKVAIRGRDEPDRWKRDAFLKLKK
jgi:hypothetical protein